MPAIAASDPPVGTRYHGSASILHADNREDGRKAGVQVAQAAHGPADDEEERAKAEDREEV